MILNKDEEFGKLNKERYEKIDKELAESFLKMKTDNHNKIVADKDAVEAVFMGNKELQDQINKMNEHLENIEKNHVELQHLSVNI